MYNSSLKSERGSLFGCLHGKHFHLVYEKLTPPKWNYLITKASTTGYVTNLVAFARNLLEHVYTRS